MAMVNATVMVETFCKAEKVLTRTFMQTRSRTRKRTLDTAEETDEVLDISEKIDFEDSDSGTEQKEPVIMGDRIVQADPALMDFSWPKIDDIQPSILHPAIQANTFEIKSGTIQMVQNSVSFGGAATEDPNMHIRNFVKICSTFKYNGVTDEAIKLRLFPFSLRDKAKAGYILNQLGPSLLGKILCKSFW
ncbi:hypothetical protein AgCh_006117 [Apium graveolens]